MTTNVNRFFVIVTSLIVFCLSGCVKADNTELADGDFASATIGHEVYSLEAAKSSEARAKGLSGRDQLDNNSGMLFIFDSYDYHSFWMKDTHFTLEIIWLDENFTVVDKKVMVVENDPANPVASYTPQSPASYAIEIKPINDIDGIQIGEKVEISY